MSAVTAAWLGTTSGVFTVTTNWSTGAVPVAGDSIIFDGRATRALTGSPATSIQLASIKHYMSCAYDVCTAAIPLVCFADNVEVGLEATDGSSGGGSEFHIAPTTNIGSKMIVYNSKSTGTSGLDPVTLDTGTPASGNHTFQIEGGTAGIATSSPSAAATILTMVATGGRLNLGAGMVTGWSLTQGGSGNPKVFVNSATSGTITVNAGELTTEGTGLIATVTGYGGKIFMNHRLATAIVTTMNLRGSILDLSGDLGAVLFTNYSERSGTVILAYSTQLSVTTPSAPDFNVQTKRVISLS
jgi:hypothetical protein